MLERVGERLLHDAVRGEVDARRQLARRARDTKLDGETGRANVPNERVELCKGRLRRHRDLLVLGAEHAEQPPHLVERLRGGSLDRVDGRAGVVGLGLEAVPRPSGLEDDDADRVRDDVVQLAGDARALLEHCEARLLLPLDDQVALARTPPADRAAGEPRAPEDRREEDEVADEVEERPLVPVDDRREDRHRPDQHGSEDRPATARVRSDRVDRDAERDRKRQRVLVGRRKEVDQDPRADVHRQHGERIPHAPEQRERDEQHERHEERALVVEVEQEQLGLRNDGEPDCEYDVSPLVQKRSHGRSVGDSGPDGIGR